MKTIHQGKPFTIGKYQIVLAVKTVKTGTPATKIKTKALPQLLYRYKRKFLYAGQRTDVPGYCDQLTGAVRQVLKLKPALTSLAAIKYCNPEELLKTQPMPLLYKDQIIFFRSAQKEGSACP
jgi:lipopolysaccharide/colanic/teichoic acid biosynthesis glycosyltransferase